MTDPDHQRAGGGNARKCAKSCRANQLCGSTAPTAGSPPSPRAWREGVETCAGIPAACGASTFAAPVGRSSIRSAAVMRRPISQPSQSAGVRRLVSLALMGRTASTTHIPTTCRGVAEMVTSCAKDTTSLCLSHPTRARGRAYLAAKWKRQAEGNYNDRANAFVPLRRRTSPSFDGQPLGCSSLVLRHRTPARTLPAQSANASFVQPPRWRRGWRMIACPSCGSNRIGHFRLDCDWGHGGDWFAANTTATFAG